MKKIVFIFYFFVFSFICIQAQLPVSDVDFNEKNVRYPDKEMFRVAKYKGDKTAAISYTFDDGLAEHFSLVFPAFEKLGFKGTFWINGRALSDTAFQRGIPRVTWKQLKKMAKRRHEISSHGWAHRNITKLSLEELRYELQHNDTAIFLITGVFPRTFCYPGNAKNDNVIAVVESDRIASRTHLFDVGGKITDENLEKQIAELVANGNWCVTMTHGITYGYDCFFDANVLWRHLQKVKAQEDKIWIGTFAEVAAYMKERQNFTFETKKTDNGFIISPHLSLNKNLFTEKLTMVFEMQVTTKITVKQGNKKLKTKALPGKILFDIDPSGGTIDVKLFTI